MSDLRTTLNLDDPKTGVWMLVTDPRHVAEYLTEQPLPLGNVVTECTKPNGDIVRWEIPIADYVKKFV